MPKQRPLWITEEQVVEVLTLGDAIAALEETLRYEAAGTAQNMVKTHVIWGTGHTLHAIGAVAEGLGVATTKTWAHTAAGSSPLVTLIDRTDGSVKAIIEGFALGQLRTSAISGVATDRLARRDSVTMAILGTGKQALPQVRATTAVRHLKLVSVFSPNLEHCHAFAADVERELGISAVVSSGADEAVPEADIVTVVTRAREPFLGDVSLRPGTHINAVGAITPERAEIKPGVLQRSSLTVADNVSQVQSLSLYLLYNPATGRTNGTTNNFFTTTGLRARQPYLEPVDLNEPSDEIARKIRDSVAKYGETGMLDPAALENQNIHVAAS
jgi:ornithine cyclodeaminase